MARTILALGGGGFTTPPGDPALDELVLELTGRREPRVLFLPTASGDAGDQVHRFLDAYMHRACQPKVLSLFKLREQRLPLRDLILAQDAIYVGGGSMRNLVALWREHGVDELLHEAWEQGTVLAGLSAGAMSWFEQGLTRSAGAAAPAPGLGFLSGSFSVHRDSEPGRRPAFLEAVEAGTMEPGWAADDGAGIVFSAGHVERVVSARAGAGVSRVVLADGIAVERELEAERLGTPGTRVQQDAAVRELRAVRGMRARGVGARH